MRKQDMENQFSKKTRKKARSIQAQRIFRSRWFKSLVAMGSVVVFCTVYSLIIPAATLTEDEASADAGIVLEEAAPSEPQVVEAPAETPAPEPVQEEASKEEPVVQAAAAVEEAPAEQTKEAPTAASSETVTETPAEAASTAASTEQSLNESAAAGSGSEETKTENAETANTAAANETAPAEETSGTATDETATEGTDAALTTEKTTEEASTADSEESVEKTTGEEEEVGTVSELKGTSGNLEAVVRFAEGAGIPENATLAIYGGSADTGKVQDALWNGSMDSIEQSTITTDLSEYVSFAVKDVDGNDITPDSDCSIEISFGSEADLSDPGENKIKKYGTLVIGSDGNVSVTGTSLSTGDGHTYATFSGKLSGNTFGFAVTTADKKVNYLEGLSGKTSDGAVEASLTFGKDVKVPEGSTLTVESVSVSESSVLDKLWGNYEGVDKDTVTADDVQFVKFVIRGKDGKEISPETKVSVNLTFHHEADLSSAAEGKVKKYNALAVSSDGTITLGSKALSAENGITTAFFADVSAKNSLGYAVSSADKKVVYAARLTGKSEDGTIEASLRLTEEAKIPEGSLLKVTPVTGESVQKTLLDNIWTDTSIIDPDTIELTDSGLAAVTITDKDGNALKPEADATLTLTFDKEANLKEAARKMVKRAKTVAMTEENVKLSDDGLSAAEGKTKVSYTGIVDGQTFGYAVSTAKQKTNFLEGKLSYKGDGYTIELSVSNDNQIPEGAKLSVSELDSKSNDYQNKLGQAQEAILKEAQKKTSENVEVALNEASAHLYDISLENEDGEKIQPNGKVTVKITYDSAIQISKDESMQTVHFDENADERQVLSTKVTEETSGDSKKVSAISFDTDGLSVYAIVGAEEKTAELKGVANTLEATIGNVAFKVSYDADAGLPDGTKLVVKSVDADDYSDATAKALGDVEIVDEKYFDISFEYDGEVIEPKSDVNVTITLSGDDRLTEGNEVKVVHFENGKDKAPEVIGNVVAEGGKKVAEETADSNVAAAKPNLMRRAARTLATPNTVDSGSESVVNFKSDSFSVYGIVDTSDSTTPKIYRTTYNFQYDDGSDYTFSLDKNPAASASETPVAKTTSSQIVKDGGQILDVGIPSAKLDVNKGKTFLGWAEVTESTVSETHILLPTAGASGLTSDQTITLRAVFGDQVNIVFHDESGSVIKIIQADKNTEVDISSVTTEKAGDYALAGWTTTNSVTDDAIVEYTTSVTTGEDNIYLYPVFAAAHSITFDSNDGGDGSATVIEAQRYPANQKTVAPTTDPERQGYTFSQWYTDKACTMPFTWGETLSENITLYAGWTPSKTTYKVIIWKQRVDDKKDAAVGDKNDDYSETYTVEAKTGDQINGSTPALKKYKNLADDMYKGFKYASSGVSRTDSTTNVTVKGDGSSVINVYYDRQLITMKFNYSEGNQRVYKEATDNDGDQYRSVNGVYQPIYYHNGNWYTTRTGRWPFGYDYSGLYTGTRYKASYEYVYGHTVTMTGLYGQTLDFNGYTWPGSDGPWQYYAGNGWKGMTFLGEFVLPGYQEGDGQSSTIINFHQSGEIIGAYYYFYLENADGTWPEVASYTGSAKGGGTFQFTEKFANFNVTSYQFNPENGNSGNWTVANVGASVSMNGRKSIGVRYKRRSFQVEFYNGSELLNNEQWVRYEDSLSTIKTPDPSTFSYSGSASVADNYEFVGWFADPEATTYVSFSPLSTEEQTGLQTLYPSITKFETHETMPGYNLRVYAGWKPKRFTVTIDVNGGNLPTEIALDNNNSFAVDYGDFVTNSIQKATREGYELLGWYITNPDGTLGDPWIFGSPVTKNIKLTAKWRSTGQYRVRYVNDATPDDENTNALFTDTSVYYRDNATVTTIDWATTGKTAPKGYQFSGWNYNDSTYMPCATFTVDISGAAAKYSGTENGINYVYVYAVYTKIDTTSITYNANGGTGNLTDIGDGVSDNIQRNIPLNQGITLSSGAGFTRVGFKLTGWNSDKIKADNGIVEWKCGETVGVDGVSNTLYAVWKKSTNIIIKKTGTDGAALTGAEFDFTFTNAYGSLEGVNDHSKVTIDSPEGVRIDNLENGHYTLKETKAPDGYIISTSDTNFTIDDEGVMIGNAMADTEIIDGKTYYVISISNTAGAKLPSTGGTGTLPYTLGGLAIISMVALMYGYVARRNKQERG